MLNSEETEKEMKKVKLNDYFPDKEGFYLSAREESGLTYQTSL